LLFQHRTPPSSSQRHLPISERLLGARTGLMLRLLNFLWLPVVQLARISPVSESEIKAFLWFGRPALVPPCVLAAFVGYFCDFPFRG